MKNHVYNPLQKLVLVVMLLFAGSAVAQTTTGTKAESKSFDGRVVSPKASEAQTQKPAANPAHTTKATGPVKASTGVTAETRKQNSANATKVAKPNTNPAQPAKKAVATHSTSKPAPISREAELKAYIADIDAKLPKVKGQPAEGKLLAKKASFQKELSELKAKQANQKKN